MTLLSYIPHYSSMGISRATSKRAALILLLVQYGSTRVQMKDDSFHRIQESDIVVNTFYYYHWKMYEGIAQILGL